jgi:hypothetical protein
MEEPEKRNDDAFYTEERYPQGGTIADRIRFANDELTRLCRKKPQRFVCFRWRGEEPEQAVSFLSELRLPVALSEDLPVAINQLAGLDGVVMVVFADIHLLGRAKRRNEDNEPRLTEYALLVPRDNLPEGLPTGERLRIPVPTG